MIVGSGSMIGEEDAISQNNEYTCTAVCSSLKGSVFCIDVADFMTLKQSSGSWIGILRNSEWKENLKQAGPGFELPKSPR